MRAGSPGIGKRILETQLLSFLFAFISVTYSRFAILSNLVFTNPVILFIILYGGVALIIAVFTVVTGYFSDGKWLNVFLISIPYAVHWFILLLLISKVFPAHGHEDDYGAGLLLLFANICLWTGVIILSVVGTYSKIKR